MYLLIIYKCVKKNYVESKIKFIKIPQKILIIETYQFNWSFEYPFSPKLVK